MEHIYQYEKLYGEKTSWPNAEYLFSELLETRSRSFGWNIKPHIHPCVYQLFFVEKGSFTFYEVKRQKQLEGPCLILVPSTIFHGFVYNPDAKGRILSISDTMIDILFEKLGFLAPMLENLQILTIFTEHLRPEKIKVLIETIDEELFNCHSEKHLMLQVCLQQLFVVIYRLWKNNQSDISKSDHLSLAYFRKFQQQVRRTDKTRSIAQLAKELGITPVHLNRICRQVAGQSAGQLVQGYVIDEARKYLKYTSRSVSEIAYILNFEYPNYFARFFKKHTGLTPKQFRGQEDKLPGNN